MRFLQDVVVRGDTATTAVVQDNVFEDDVVGGDEDAVNNVFEILGTIGGTLIAVSFRSLSLSLSRCVCRWLLLVGGWGCLPCLSLWRWWRWWRSCGDTFYRHCGTCHRCVQKKMSPICLNQKCVLCVCVNRACSLTCHLSSLDK